MRLHRAGPIRILAFGWKSFVRDIWASRSLPDARQKLWDTRLKIIAVFGVVLSAGWAVVSYNYTAEREIQKPLWDKQLALYFEATEVTAQIATSAPANEDRVKAEHRFWQLYFGPLRVAEYDDTVGAAMQDFGLCLTQPGDSGPKVDCDKGDLQDKSLKLGLACRTFLAKNWNYKMGDLSHL